LLAQVGRRPKRADFRSAQHRLEVGVDAQFVELGVTISAAKAYRRTMQRSFRRAVERAELDPAMITPHVMRHTAITRLVEAGVDLPTIQRISGHKTLAMVLRYSHVSGAHIDAAIAALDRTIPEPAVENQNDASTQVTQELHKRGA
jgi:site-specific recombinase XerD